MTITIVFVIVIVALVISYAVEAIEVNAPYRSARKEQRLQRQFNSPRYTQRANTSTTKLAMLAHIQPNNTPVDNIAAKPASMPAIEAPFDNDKYLCYKAEYSAVEAKAKNVSTYHVSESADIGQNIVVDTYLDTIDNIDTYIDTVLSELNLGITEPSVALASEKLNDTVESTSISVPNSLLCGVCGFEARNIRALNGHKKAHSSK